VEYKQGMKMALTADGQIGIPPEIRQADHLGAGDLFSFDRLTSGHYVLTKVTAPSGKLMVVTAEDGLPVIRAKGAVITSQIVKEIESQTP
jgi:hypothetical protein